MSSKTKILFLTICSLTKLPGGTSEYDEQDAVTSRLPADAGDFLLQTREKVRRWLKRTGTEWQGVPIQNLEYNQNLVCGRDFGGKDQRAMYYPVLRRYEGRFYQALGQEGKLKLFRSKHHVLFLSGLYGLLCPMEPIQLYSCPVEINSKPFDIWTDGDTLTNVLTAYISEHGITRVFDFTAVLAYRRLISWPSIRVEVKGQVLHCFGSMAAGADLLVPFGHLMKDYFLEATEDELLHIQCGTKKSAVNQDIWFNETLRPPSGKPHEIERASLELADRLERQRRGVIRFLDRVENRRSSDKSTGYRIARLEKERTLEPEEAKAMKVITDLRNKVVYGEFPPEQKDLEKVENAWEYLATRVGQHRWKIAEFQI
jgi:hypothetical protein